MIKSFTTALLSILFISGYTFAADSVKVETKNYSAAFSDEYRTDTAQYNLPVITGGGDAGMIAELNTYIVSDSILFDNIDTVIANYKMCGCGTVGADYDVMYNKNSVLSISVYIATMGAYPDQYYKYVNLDLTTGKRLMITDVIRQSKLKPLASKLDKRVQQRIHDKIIESLKDNMQAEINSEIQNLKQFFGEDKFTEESLARFSFTNNGIVFYFDYGLPHVVNALSPDEDILVTWDELKDYVKENSVLDKIIINK